MKRTMKFYKPADSMVEKLDRIEEYLRNTLAMHEEFCTLQADEIAYYEKQHDKAQMLACFSRANVEGPVIAEMKKLIDSYSHVLEGKALAYMG